MSVSGWWLVGAFKSEKVALVIHLGGFNMITSRRGEINNNTLKTSR